MLNHSFRYLIAIGLCLVSKVPSGRSNAWKNISTMSVKKKQSQVVSKMIQPIVSSLKKLTLMGTMAAVYRSSIVTMRFQYMMHLLLGRMMHLAFLWDWIMLSSPLDSLMERSLITPKREIFLRWKAFFLMIRQAPRALPNNFFHKNRILIYFSFVDRSLKGVENSESLSPSE